MKQSSEQIVRDYLQQLVEEQLDSDPEGGHTQAYHGSTATDEQADFELLAHLSRVDGWAQSLDGLWPEKLSAAAPDKMPEKTTAEIAEDSTTNQSREESVPAAFLSDPAKSVAADQIPWPPNAEGITRDSATDRRLGRFRVIRPLGIGGMGSVLLAYDPIMQREVALKIPHPGMLVNPAARTRFLREARAAGLLNHPGVITVYEAGEIGSICYIASEYDPGTTLADWLSRQTGPIPTGRAAEIVRQLAEAVEHAHQRGVIHRDLKPSNVLMDSAGPDSHGMDPNGKEGNHPETSTPDHSPYPRIIDFGLAHLADEQLTLTQLGTQLGTAAYMAPEQVAGRSKEVSATTDIFSLGILLFELLTRISPFQREGLTKTLAAIGQDEPRLASYRTDVPRDLDAICMRALAKSPARRYRSARELAEDLQRFLRGEPVVARPVGRLERSLHWCQRHPASAGLITVSVLATVLLVGLSLQHAHDMAGVNRGLANSLAESERLRELATSAATDAQQKTDLLQRHLYVADINRAYRAWEEQDLRQYENLLLRHQPSGNHAAGIEWRFLWRLGHPLVRNVDRTRTPIYSICPTPSGETFAVAAADGTVRVYDARDYAVIGQFPTGQGEVNSISFSSAGKLMATAGDDGSVKIWQWRDQSESLVIEAHEDLAFGSIFLPDNKTLATWGREPIIRLWDVDTGQQRGVLNGHSRSVQHVQLSPDGKRLASASDDRTVVLWDLNDFKPLVTFTLPERVGCVTFSPDGNSVFLGTVNGVVQGWDLRTEQRIFSTRALNDIHSMAVSRSGKELAFGDDEGVVRVYNLKSKHATAISKLHEDRVYALQFTPDGEQLISGGRDGALNAWAFRLAARCRQVTSPEVPWLAAAGNHLLVGAGKQGVHLIDPATGRALKTLEPNGQWIRPQCSVNGKSLVACSDSNEVRLWHLPTGTVAHRWQLTQHAQPRAISHDARTVAIVTSDKGQNHFTLYDTTTGSEVRKFQRPASPVRVAFSSDDKTLAYAHNDAIWLWNLDSDEHQGPIRGSMGSIAKIIFSPDGQVLASANGNRKIQLWDIEDASWLTALEGHQQAVRDVQFFAGGATILSRDNAGFGFWDVATSQQFYYHQIGKSPHDLCTPPDNPTGQLVSVAVAPDQSWLALGGKGMATSIIDLAVDGLPPARDRDHATSDSREPLKPPPDSKL